MGSQLESWSLVTWLRNTPYQEPTTPEPDTENWLQQFPLAWVQTGGMGLALHRTPVYTEIEAGADAIKVCQYPVPLEAKRGIIPTYRDYGGLGS